MTPGPDYYRLADGRQFYEYSRDEIVPMCKGLDPWDVHCIISAAEHYFRMGAKAGEYDTDLEAYDWWLARCKYRSEAMDVMVAVTEQRRKVGR